MKSLTLASPAKLNLYLRVVGKEPDGYHKIVTLFHRISLKDTLHFRKRKQGFVLHSSDPSLPTDERNLISQAYNLLKAKIPTVGGVSVRLTKRIPMKAGLGGGSSNAAIFLLGMKRLYRLPISLKELVKLGRQLGADVPFFLHDIPQALGTGRGDRITPKPVKRKKVFLLVKFTQGLVTKRVYELLPRPLPAVFLTKVSRDATITCKILGLKNISQNAGFLQNDLRQPAIQLKPSIQRTIAKINQCGVSLAGMSGSGPTVFAILSDLGQARRLARQLSKDVSADRIYICHSF